MTHAQDPRRWKDSAEAPSQWNDVVRADEADGPDAATLRRMLQGVADGLGRPELQPSPVPAAASGFGWSGATYVALAITVGLGAYLGSSARIPERAAPVAAPAAPAVREVEPVQTAARVAASVAPPESRPAPAPRARAAARRVQPDAVDPVAEIRLLERAQRALPEDPRAALALAEQHRRQFARGTLAQEREMLAIDALLRLGQRARAERRARSFSRHYASSSHRARLEDLLGARP